MKHFGVHPGPVSVGYSTGYGPWPREGRYVPIEKSNCVTLSVRNPEWSMFGGGLEGLSMVDQLSWGDAVGEAPWLLVTGPSVCLLLGAALT